jgi:ribosomal protein L33
LYFRSRTHDVERYRNATHTKRCQIREYEVPTVSAQDCNTITALNPVLGKYSAQACYLSTQFSVRRWATSTNKRNVVSRMLLNNFCKIHESLTTLLNLIT